MKKYLVTDATEEQLTLDEVKRHLRLVSEETDEDSYLKGLISTARKLAEVGTSHYYGEQTIKFIFSKEDDIENSFELAHPYIEIISVKIYLDGEEADLSDYSIRDEKLFPEDLPSYDTLEIIHKAGKVAPPPVKSAMLLIIGHLYENREATTDLELRALPLGVKLLLGSDKAVI